MGELIYWLSGTSLSGAVGENFWAVPTLQSIHIAAIAALMSSVLLLNLRLVGLVGSDEKVARFSRRYLPWIWWSLPVLLVTGLVLIIAEPDRTLATPVFYSKMALLLIVVGLTLVFQRPLLKDSDYWEPHARRVRARVLGWSSLALWAAIIACGRWIAYVY